jgi:uncharacterized membrane protein
MSLVKRWIVQLYVRPRLILSGCVGLSVLILMRLKFPMLDRATCGLLAWNIGAWLYLVLAWRMMMQSTLEHMRHNALRQDEGAKVILVLTLVAAVASLVSIFLELAQVKHYPAGQQWWHLGLAALTIVCSWFLVHSSFALHYAHEYYDPKANQEYPCLDFPHSTHPSYFDFMYFSFVIGMTSQTADISIISTPLRQLTLLHGVIAFFFNTTLIAVTINIAASLVQ